MQVPAFHLWSEVASGQSPKDMAEPLQWVVAVLRHYQQLLYNHIHQVRHDDNGVLQPTFILVHSGRAPKFTLAGRRNEPRELG